MKSVIQLAKEHCVEMLEIYDDYIEYRITDIQLEEVCRAYMEESLKTSRVLVPAEAHKE